MNIKKLDISVTNLCNHRCKTCSIWKTYEDGSLSVQNEVTVSEYENFFRKHDFWTNLSFTGGEPFLRKDLTEIVKCAIHNCSDLKMFSMNTNGYSTNLIVSKVEEIVKILSGKPLHINISLDGFQQFHDDNRGIKKAYENALKTFNAIQSIRNKKISIGFEYTISVHNQGELQEFMEKNSMTADDIILTLGQESYRYGKLEDSVSPDEELAKQDVKYFLSKLKPKSVLNIGQWVFLMHYLHGLKIPCVAGKNTFHADAFGDIYLCTLRNEKVGSIKNNVINQRQDYVQNCQCYTPCESYYGLTMNKIKSTYNAIRVGVF